MSGPWSFVNSLLLLLDCEKVNPYKEFGLNGGDFWVQWHVIPFAGMIQQTGQSIGERQGTVFGSGLFFGL